MIFRLAAGGIELLIKPAPPASAQAGDDEAGVQTLRPDLDPGNDPLGPVPTPGGVMEFLEAPDLGGPGVGGEPGGDAGLQAENVTSQRASRREAEHIVQAGGPAPVQDLGAAVMAIGAQQDLDPRPVGPDLPCDPAQVRPDLPCDPAQVRPDLGALGPLGRAQDDGDEAPVLVEHDDRLEAVLVEHDDRLEAVLVVMGIEIFPRIFAPVLLSRSRAVRPSGEWRSGSGSAWQPTANCPASFGKTTVSGD